MNWKRKAWETTKADRIMAVIGNHYADDDDAAFNKVAMRIARLQTTQTPNGGARVRSCSDMAGFRMEVINLGDLITKSAKKQFVTGGEIRWLSEIFDTNRSSQRDANFYFILKEDGSRVKEFIITYKGTQTYASHKIMAAWTQAHSTSKFTQTV